MFDELFREYNPNKTYDIICGKNEYVRAISKKVQAGNKPRIHTIPVYKAFMDVIDPFVDPFKYTQAQLLQKTNAHQQNFAKFANLLNSDIVQIDSQPKSWYFHFLAFHAQHCQLSSIHECGRPLASFKAEYVEASNKVKKEEAISLHAFTHRPVGSQKGDKRAPAWKNKWGF